MFLLLLTALLYPGDKIISQMDQVRPIRQPGGYYSDLIPGSTPALFKALCSKKSMAKKMDKLSVRPTPLPPSLLLCCYPSATEAEMLTYLGCHIVPVSLP